MPIKQVSKAAIPAKEPYHVSYFDWKFVIAGLFNTTLVFCVTLCNLADSNLDIRGMLKCSML
jgi:hypothetical protein